MPGPRIHLRVRYIRYLITCVARIKVQILGYDTEQRMTKATDDLEAVRVVTAALESFEADDQERIIRWAREKLGLSVVSVAATQQSSRQSTGQMESLAVRPSQSVGIKNLSTFVREKNPTNDVQFAATVAYFHRFETTPDKQKAEINADDLQDATRLVPRNRFKHPGQTLRNAHNLGLLDKGSQEGFFAINSVGENLVAMTLPSGASDKEKPKKTRKSRKTRKAKKTRATK